MSKIFSPPQSGRVGPLVSSTAVTAKSFVNIPPRATRRPRTNRRIAATLVLFPVAGALWTPPQRIAWSLAAADSYTVSRTGRRVALNGYNYFIRVNAARAHLGLSQFDLPPSVPSFSPNPVAELSITNTGGDITVKLRVAGQPGQYTLVQGAAPVSAGVRCVQHFPLLGLLPAPVDGWSDITALYVARYGVPIVGTAVFIRTCQHTDGWTDLPKVASAFVPAG